MAARLAPALEPKRAASRAGDPAILAAAATGIVPAIEKQRGDVDRIFGHAGVAPELAGSPTLQLSLSSFCQLMEQSAKLTRNDNFGLWFGNQFGPRDLGLLGYACISAPTVGSALAALCELFPLHQQSTTMRMVREDRGLISLEYRIDAPDIHERRQDAELSLGTFLNVIRECKGPYWAPEEVHFEHSEPEGKRDHQRAFSAPAYFSQRRNALLFKAEVLNAPMPARDARLHETMRVCMRQLSEKNDLRVSIVDCLRSALRANLPDGVPTLDQMADELRLPVGVLQRELNAAGLRYTDLVEVTRRDLALTHIAQARLSLTEIARILGYSELSAFSRAVRRWTGESPRALRESSLNPNKLS